MSPLPVRVETNANFVPSGEYSGRNSFAGSVTSSRASPPPDDTVQMSPPLAKAISFPSGEIAGSDRLGSEAGLCAFAQGSATHRATASSENRMKHNLNTIGISWQYH